MPQRIECRTFEMMDTHSQSRRTSSGFRDRREAGRLLALELVAGGALAETAGNLVVVGLARGGVEVAAEVAAVLHAPLDALAVRKVGHPLDPEYGIGAIAPGGVAYVGAYDGSSEKEVADAVLAAAKKAVALDTRLHERHTPLSVAGKDCILVDDGLATGGTMIASIRWAHTYGARRVIVAVPVGAAQTVDLLERQEDIDAVICLVSTFELVAVGAWYDDFHQVSDTDVAELLETSRDREIVTSRDEVVIGDNRHKA